MQYTVEWLEYWENRAAQVEFTYCPSCGQDAMMAKCEHCGYDIATYYENDLRAQAQEIARLPQCANEW